MTELSKPDLNFKRKMEKALALFVNIATNHYEVAFKSVPGKEKVAPVGKPIS